MSSAYRCFHCGVMVPKGYAHSHALSGRNAAIKRPLLFARCGRTFGFDRGELTPLFTIVVILAPFPEEEQEAGAYTAALVNAQITFRPHWPFVSFDLYAADRWTSKPRCEHD